METNEGRSQFPFAPFVHFLHINKDAKGVSRRYLGILHGCKVTWEPCSREQETSGTSSAEGVAGLRAAAREVRPGTLRTSDPRVPSAELWSNTSVTPE